MALAPPTLPAVGWKQQRVPAAMQVQDSAQGIQCSAISNDSTAVRLTGAAALLTEARLGLAVRVSDEDDVIGVEGCAFAGAA